MNSFEDILMIIVGWMCGIALAIMLLFSGFMFVGGFVAWKEHITMRISTEKSTGCLYVSPYGESRVLGVFRCGDKDEVFDMRESK